MLHLWARSKRICAACGPASGEETDCVLHEEADALWFDTPLPLPPYNAVLRFAASKDVDRRIDSLFEYYRRRDVPFVWMVHPTARPLDLDDRLRARGLQEVETCQGMSMRLDQLPDPEEPPDGIEIHEVPARATRANSLASSRGDGMSLPT